MADRAAPKKESESEQILASLGSILRTRRRLLLTCTLGVLIPVLAFNELVTPVYESSLSLVFDELASPVRDDFTAEAAREYQMFDRIEEMNSLAFAEDLARALPDSLLARVPIPDDVPKKDRFRAAGDALHEGLNASALRNTNIVRVRARTADPQLSMVVANLTPLVLEERSHRVRKEGATGLRTYVDDQLTHSKARLQESEDELRRYKEQHGVSSFEGESSETLRKLTEAEVMYNSTKADRGAAERRLQAVKRTLASQRGSLVPNITDTASPSATSLKERLVMLEGQYAQLSVQGYDSNHPRMAQLRQEISQAKRTLTEEATRLARSGSASDPISHIEQLSQESINLQLQVESLRARESALLRIVGEYRSTMGKVPNLEVELARLTRERDANQKTYTSLLDNRETIRVALTKKLIPNSRVVDWGPLPEEPIFPRKPLNLALGVVLGLMLGCGVGLFLESGRSSLRSMVAFEDQTGWPVLARVPASKIGGAGRLSTLKGGKEWDVVDGDSQRALISHSDPASAAGEAYFMLRTRLELLGMGTKYKTLMVTSTAPRDGKSSTLCNLAATFGAAGRSALVIDAELRRPVIHRYFGVNQWPGVSDLLLARRKNGTHPGPSSNGEAPHPIHADRELFQATKVENVTVLACGSRVSENEWESTRPHFGALLEELRGQYDVLLVDSAPPVLVHDTLALCSLVDAVIVVVNTESYHSHRLHETKRLLEQAGANIVGAVINRVEPYGTYSYYYDRRYSPREPGDSPVTSRV